MTIPLSRELRDYAYILRHGAGVQSTTMLDPGTTVPFARQSIDFAAALDRMAARAEELEALASKETTECRST